MTSLIERLQSAEVGSRELDDEVWLWLKSHGQIHQPAHDRFTTSIDSIVALIKERLPGWKWCCGEVEYLTADKGWAMLSYRYHSAKQTGHVYAKTVPLALCSALLLAIEAAK